MGCTVLHDLRLIYGGKVSGGRTPASMMGLQLFLFLVNVTNQVILVVAATALPAITLLLSGLDELGTILNRLTILLATI